MRSRFTDVSNSISRAALLVVAILLLSGCKPAANTTDDSNAEVPLSSAEGDSSSSTDAADTDTTDSADDSAATDDIQVSDTQEIELTEVAAVDDEPSGPIVLGDAVLTSGIPGEGELTIEQIQSYIDDPSNHEVIEPILPVGLSAAQANIQGVSENPLTKAKISSVVNSISIHGCRQMAPLVASCHHPDEGYGRKTQFGEGVDGQTGNRNSPVSYNRIVSGPQFWDGRAKSLEEQAAGPIANPIEMGNTHEKAVDTVKSIDGYRIQFEKVFPGEEISIDNITKAIATFERLVTGASPYDYFETVRTIQESYADELEDLEEEDPELYAQYQVALAVGRDDRECRARTRAVFLRSRGLHGMPCRCQLHRREVSQSRRGHGRKRARFGTLCGHESGSR